MTKQPDKTKCKPRSLQDTELVDRLLSGTAEERYQGKQVVVMGGQIFILPEDDRKAATLVEDLEKKYPNQIPHLVFVPRSEAYIL
jgi:hypothetical protein